METLGSIPTNVGVADLKFAALTVIYPAFKKWSCDYPISLNDVKLRSQKWVEFVPKDPDIDTVKDQCYTVTGKQPKLKSNAHVTVYLSITEELFHKIEEHIDAYELQEVKKLSPQRKRQRVGDTLGQEDCSDDDKADDVSKGSESDDEGLAHQASVHEVTHKQFQVVSFLITQLDMIKALTQ